MLRARLDDKAGIGALPPSWLTIYPAPADKVNLEERIRRAWDLRHGIIQSARTSKRRGMLEIKRARCAST